jgi:nucleotide-binding universal stress UspA family protein
MAPPNCYAVATFPAVVLLDQTADDGEALRRELAEEARSAGVAMEFLSVRGTACSELRRLAAERRAEVLVVGASESRWRRPAGSLSARLVRTRQLPVVVVP